MRRINALGYALSGSAILALLAGCSGGGSSSSPMPASPASLMHQPPSRSIDASSRRNADPTSVVLPNVGRISRPDLSVGFADVDAAAEAAIVVSDAGTDDVYAFSPKGKLVATITERFQDPARHADRPEPIPRRRELRGKDRHRRGHEHHFDVRRSRQRVVLRDGQDHAVQDG